MWWASHYASPSVVKTTAQPEETHEFEREDPAKFIASVAVVALAAGLAACGGDDSGGSGDPDTGSSGSLDQPVQDGMKKSLEAKIKAGGDDIKIDWQKVENINQLIITRSSPATRRTSPSCRSPAS